MVEISASNREKIIALLREGVCPICGKKFINPLNHISKKHGIPANELKDTILVGHLKSFSSPELSAKLSQAAISQNRAAQLQPGYGEKHTTTAKKKIRMATLDEYKKNPEHLAAFKNSNKKIGAQKSAATTRKPVVRISNTGEIKTYGSISEAATDNKVSISSISRCVNGKQSEAIGYKWQYVEVD